MKTIKYLSILILSVLFLASCEKDDPKVMLNSTSKPTVTLSTTGALVLSVSTASNNVLTVNYDNVNFGFNDAMSYVLQIAPVGLNFRSDTMVQINVDRPSLKKTFTGAELNTLLLNEYSPAGRTLNLEMRIVTSPGNIASAAVPLTITTYEDWPRILPYTSAPNQFLYIPGDYQFWSPGGTPIAKVYSVSSDKKYSGTIVLPDASKGFKFTPAPNWDNDYGMTSITVNGNDVSGSLQYKAGSDFKFTGSGTYTLDVNLNDNTWKAAKSTWSIIGEAGINWDTDIDLEFDIATQTFFKIVSFKVGEWKFRKNHAWNGGDFPSPNLKITEAGTYKVLLDMRVPSDPYWKVIKQ